MLLIFSAASPLQSSSSSPCYHSSSSLLSLLLLLLLLLICCSCLFLLLWWWRNMVKVTERKTPSSSSSYSSCPPFPRPSSFSWKPRLEPSSDTSDDCFYDPPITAEEGNLLHLFKHWLYDKKGGEASAAWTGQRGGAKHKPVTSHLIIFSNYLS